MKEHSQIEDMRAAVRGDIERAKKRRTASPVPQEPVPVPEEPKPQSGLFSIFRKRS